MVDKRKREMLPDLLTYPQAAKILGITPAGVCQAVRRGKLSVVRFGHVVLVPKSALEMYVKAKSKGGRPRKKPQ